MKQLIFNISKCLLCALIGVFISAMCAYSVEDAAVLSGGGEWDDIMKMQNSWDGQKIITDEEFEKVYMDRKYGNANKRAKDTKKYEKKYGKSLTPEYDAFTHVSLNKLAEEYPTMLVPTTLITKSGEVPSGFYKVVSGKNKAGQGFINFYQGNDLVAKVYAADTDDDFDAETINYANIIYNENNKTAKIVCGSVDFNLVAEVDTY